MHNKTCATRRTILRTSQLIHTARTPKGTRTQTRGGSASDPRTYLHDEARNLRETREEEQKAREDGDKRDLSPGKERGGGGRQSPDPRNQGARRRRWRQEEEGSSRRDEEELVPPPPAVERSFLAHPLSLLLNITICSVIVWSCRDEHCGSTRCHHQ